MIVLQQGTLACQEMHKDMVQCKISRHKGPALLLTGMSVVHSLAISTACAASSAVGDVKWSAESSGCGASNRLPLGRCATHALQGAGGSSGLGEACEPSQLGTSKLE